MENSQSSSKKTAKAGRLEIPKPGSSIHAASAKSVRARRRGPRKSRSKPIDPKNDHIRDPLEERHRLHPASFAPRRGLEQTGSAAPATPHKSPRKERREGIPADSEDDPASRHNPRSRLTRPVFSPEGIPDFRKLRFGFLAALAVLLGVFVLFRGSPQEEEGSARPATKADLEAVNEALQLSRSGKPGRALEKLRALEKRNPEAPSLDYLFALVALESGDTQTAAERAGASIRKGQRVSDSLVLKSLAESSTDTAGFRDAAVVRESLLRQAIAADPASPFAMVELANLLRDGGHDEEALVWLKAARTRLHPVDTHVVVETSIRLLELHRLPDGGLPETREEGTLAGKFANAYIHLRRGREAEARAELETCRALAGDQLFEYLASDAVFSRFPPQGNKVGKR